jgi:transcriptional regulator with XRE-family HTH domain
LAGAVILQFRAMDQLPNRIRELRKARGMKLEALANRVGCAVSMMSDLERGNRDLTHHWMKIVARVLKVQVADLLSDKENSKSLSAAERELVDLYSAADEAQRAQMLQMMRILAGGALPKVRKAA